MTTDMSLQSIRNNPFSVQLSANIDDEPVWRLINSEISGSMVRI
jgi:hypothetical protein